MYCLVIYDLSTERVNKLHNYLKMYLNWVQNSVFEGGISNKDYEEMIKNINEIIEESVDSVLIFKFKSTHCFEKEVIGKEKNPITNII